MLEILGEHRLRKELFVCDDESDAIGGPFDTVVILGFLR